MLRTALIAAGVVVIAAIAYFAVVETNETALAPGYEQTPEAVAVDQNERIAEENMSNRAASDAATDEAFESARELEEPVQSNLESSRAAADATGAVGAAAFTPEGFDRVIVISTIEESELTEEEKDALMALLAEIEPAGGELEPALAQIRAALEIEY
jgi:hypothetical protein